MAAFKAGQPDTGGEAGRHLQVINETLLERTAIG